MGDKYQQALDYLYSFIDYETMHQPRSPLNYDLRRMEELLVRLDNPHLGGRTVHIAGTKGKGSTAAMIASALTYAGYRTGLYTSPHLVDLRERIRSDGQLISKPELVELVARLKPEVAAVNQRAAYGKLTTFEILTALGFSYFSMKAVDFRVIETGLGGRLDATNVVKPEVCAITTIGLDHTDVLGDSLAQIAGEKTGIIKPGVAVVSAPQDEAAARVVAEVCQQKRSRLIRVGDAITYKGKGTKRGRQLLEIIGRLGSYSIALPLLGQYQQQNAAVAVGALEVLAEKGSKLAPVNIINGLEKVRWPGRFQIIQKQPTIVLDGAHNPAAAHELRKAIESYLSDTPRQRRTLVIGTSSDKDYTGVAHELGPIFDIVIATHSRHPRALNSAVLANAFQESASEVKTAGSVAQALKQAVSLAGKNGFICATGSLFIVGEALEWAHKRGY